MEAIRHEVWIKAEPSTVFAALTTQAGLDGWWGKAVSAEAKVGHVVEFDHGHGAPLLMRITELVPNERLVWRMISDHPDPEYPGSEWLGHELRFDLRSAADDPLSGWLSSHAYEADDPEAITILRFEQTGWKSDARWYAFCNTAWGTTLDSDLRELCESSTSAGR